MEMSQGNSLYTYLKQTDIAVIFFYKIGQKEGGTGSVLGGKHQWETGNKGKCAGG
jgi:hypothetical protein